MLAIKEKKIFRFILLVSAVVLLTVVIVGRLPKADHIPWFVPYLPMLNAFINGTCSVILLISFYNIKRKNITIHKRLNITALVLSSIFMISYVLFHSFGIETRYPADNPVRPLYLTILISHIILAAIVLPLVLFSFYYGLDMNVEKHKKIVRWSFPIWLYVTVSGVVVYLMISPYYQF